MLTENIGGNSRRTTQLKFLDPFHWEIINNKLSQKDVMKVHQKLTGRQTGCLYGNNLDIPVQNLVCATYLVKIQRNIDEIADL